MKSFTHLSIVLISFCLLLNVSFSEETDRKPENNNIEKSSAAKIQPTHTLDVNRHLSKKKSYVKIATIGARPLTVDPQIEPQKVVDKIIAHWQKKFAQVLPDKPDLIVVPEACDRPAGFSLDKRLQYYRVRKNQVRDYFANVAKENNCYIVYSAARQTDDGFWRNSSVMLDRKGYIAGIYNKNHLVIEENTQAGILYGEDAPVIECDFGRVAFAICFDLNFDELRAKYVEARPDLILFPSMYHGGLMQAYWAYSCRSHFVAAVAGLPCEIYNPLGQVVASSTNYFDFVVATVNLDCRLVHLDYNWGRLKAMKDKYGPQVKITDPGRLGAVLVSSQSKDITADDMIKEFKIELLDDYMKRALQHRHQSLQKRLQQHP